MDDILFPALTRLDNEDITVRNASLSPHLVAVSARSDLICQSDQKGAPMDGGDAPSPGDHTRDKCKIAKSTHLASAGHPRIEEIIEDSLAAEEEKDGTLFEKRERNARYSEDTTVGSLKDTGEDDQEIQRLVEFVILKARADLLTEGFRTCPPSSVRHSSHELLKHSHRKSFQDESCTYVVHGHEQEIAESKIDDGETDWSTQVQQELDDLVRAVLEKANRELISENEIDFEASHIQEESKLKTMSPVANWNGGTVEKRRDTGLDFKFHNVMNRLLADCRLEDSCEEKCDLEEKKQLEDADVDLIGAEQTKKTVHEVHDKVQERVVDGSREEEAPGTVSNWSNERGSTQNEQLELTNGVSDNILTTKELDSSERTFSEEPDIVEEPRLTAIENEEVTKVMVQRRDQSEDDGKTEEQIQLVAESTSGGEDDEFLSSTSEDEEAEALVGYVIDAARSSLLYNFDVFTFNKSFEDSGAPTRERVGAIDEVQCIDTDDRVADSSYGSLTGAPELNGKNQGRDKLQSDRANGANDNNEPLIEGKNIGPHLNTKIDLRESLEKEVKQTKVEVDQGSVKNSEVEEWSKSDPVQKRAPLLIDSEVRNFDVSCQEGKEKKSELSTAAKHDVNESNLHRETKNVVMESDLNGPPKPDNQSKCLDSNHTICETTVSLPNRSILDSSIEGHTSHKPDRMVTFINPHASLTVSGFGPESDNDSDDDIDVTDTESQNDTGRLLVDENAWECLAIRQISKAQYDYGEPWCPNYNPAHLDDGDASKKHHKNNADRSKTATHTRVDPPNLVEVSTKSSLLDSSTNRTSSDKPSAGSTSSIDVHQATKSQSEPAKLNDGMALINDQLRKKIVHLEQRMKQLALELTFLGDRNWRLEAYIDCLVKTLEVMGVTDVIDLDQKILPLCLFKVKVKAGYKLVSYNGIPSRSRWSYAEEGRPAPFVDLSGYGDNTDSPNKQPDSIHPTPLPSCDDDVGLSAAQMFIYEKQLEELAIRNLVLEAQLKEANGIAQSVIMTDLGNVSDETQVDGTQVDGTQIQETEQQQMQLPQDLENLHLQLELLQQRHQAGLEYCQVKAEQQPQIFPNVLPNQQYPSPIPQHQLQSVEGQLQQPQHPPNHLLQQTPLQPQQQQRDACSLVVEVPQESVLTTIGDWEAVDQLPLQDSLEWPSLSESQSQQPWFQVLSYFPQTAATVSPDKTASPFSSSKMTTTGKTRSSLSCQNFRRGHRLEDQLNSHLLDQSRSGVGQRVRREKGSVQMFHNWEPPMVAFSPAAVPSRHGESFHHRRPPCRDVSALASSQTSHLHRTPDRNQRLFCRDLAFDSYRPDFRNFQDDSSVRRDHGESLSASSPSFDVDSQNYFDALATPPCNRGFGGSATSIGAVPYQRRHDKYRATPARRGQPWNGECLPRRSSYPSSLRSRATPDISISDTN